MDEVLIDPDVTAALRTLLEDNIDGVYVSDQRPGNIPGRYIKINMVGGTGRQSVVLSEYLITLECWGVDSVDASELARQAAAYVIATEGSKIGDMTIYSVNAGSPIDFPDLDTRRSRFVLTFSLLTRAKPIS